MHRFRPVIGAVGAASFCALLQGAVTSKAEPDAGWLHTVANLVLLTVPFALAGGVLLSLLGGAASRFGRGTAAGVFWGLALYVLPTLASFLRGLLPFGLVSWLLLAGAWLALLLWLRRSAEYQGLEPGPAGSLGTLVGLGCLALGLAGFFVPARPPAIGSVPDVAERLETGVARAPEEAPNLALVVLDTLRADRLGCHGYERETTPFLDHLADSGLRYELAQAPASHTPPSHATLFTGLLPSEHGVMSTVGGMPEDPDIATLAGRLGMHGYVSAAVVANLVIARGRNFHRGFHLYDDSLVCVKGLGAAKEALLGSAPVAALYSSARVGRFTLGQVVSKLFGTNVAVPRAAEVNALATRVLDEVREAGGPLFLFLNYMDVHAPYQAPEPYLDRFLEHDAGQFERVMSAGEFHLRFNELKTALKEGRFDEARREELAALSDRYDGELAYLDERLRDFVEEFRRKSEAQGRPWMVILTSDHGEHFGEHGLIGHGNDIWQETQHVPLLIAGTGIEPGVVGEAASLVDVGSTLLAAAGAREGLGGGAVLPGVPDSALLTPRSELRLQAGAELRGVVSEYGDLTLRARFAPIERLAIVRDGHKAWYRVDEEPGLDDGTLRYMHTFDLREDRRESEPSTDGPLRLSDGLADWAARWWKAYAEGRSKFVQVQTSDGAAARLEQIGYL